MDAGGIAPLIANKTSPYIPLSYARTENTAWAARKMHEVSVSGAMMRGRHDSRGKRASRGNDCVLTRK